MPASFHERVGHVLASGGSCLFLSPHLDDAVLSCGALVQALAGRCALTIATAFTTADPQPHTLAARSFLRACAAGDAAALFHARRAEDREVLGSLGAHHVHMGLPDALFRRRDPATAVARRLGRIVPEISHRYPTYRFDIARGRIARADRSMIVNLAAEISKLLSGTRAELLFCPLGVGQHVDHIIVRTIGESFADRVVYYSDFPYNQVSPPDPAFIAEHRLVPWHWDEGVAQKERLIRGYRTQADALFPGGRIPIVPEVYYVSAIRNGR
jgi:LmbE family N-acetylglucosaminyl deacetylase